MRFKLIKLLPVIIGFFMFSCNATNNDELVKTINELKDSQAVVQKKMNSLEKAMNNLALASKSPPSNNKQQPPKADPIKPRSWYKYARDCKEWSHLTHGHAPNFCRLARMAGQNINQEYRGLDIIKLHFPGNWANSENQKKWQTI